MKFTINFTGSSQLIILGQVVNLFVKIKAVFLFLFFVVVSVFFSFFFSFFALPQSIDFAQHGFAKCLLLTAFIGD